MNKLYIVLVISLLAGLASCSDGQDDNLIAKVNHEQLSLDELILMYPGFMSLDSLQKSLLVENWIRETLLAQEAEKNLIHRDPMFNYRVETYRRRLLAGKQLDVILKDQGDVARDEIEAYYQNNLESFKRQSNEFFGFHVLLPSRDDARDLEKAIEKGDLEKKQSLVAMHPKETGLFKVEHLFPEVKEYLLKKKRPGIFGPIKTDLGYHLVEVKTWHDRGSIKSLDEVWEEIAARLSINRQRHIETQLVDSLRKSGSILFNKSVLYNRSSE
ncbi:MAG: peptidyl-prolyl cis-trans isomerase [FCB group bacterium]|nr:peptidyl-prolyl cis-trans isomerase [FCB group bacterium]MBL7027289.1 peptidyl-prolyl cis-trans isomerase [Candidatus Neomarinimicrobiota bacterium]MBL7122259.1 peptidyl-prolyl cis-trans isomerase [Candidatus Neomarinimicrobiota bacterium]